MKKILLGLILFIPYSLHADYVTSGSLGLLIPSTGTTDTTRRWDDKIYKNFDMIASTMNKTITSIGTIATDTTTILSNLDVIRSSMVVIRQSTSTLEGVVAQRTQVFSDEGSILTGGNVTRVNCVGSSIDCSQSGSTVTVSVSASGGGAPAISTVSFTVYGGGVFLSTANPIGSTVQMISKSTWNILGIEAFINKPSSVAATSFTVWTSTSQNYGITWSSITSISVNQNARYQTYKSTAFPVYEREWFGVGIGTIPISGLQPEDWGITFHLWRNVDSQSY